MRSAGETELAQVGETAIVLRGGDFLNVWEHRIHYFLSDGEHCLHRSSHVDAYEANGHNHAVFYRGIKIHDTRLPTLFRYNLRDTVTLTEDRAARIDAELARHYARAGRALSWNA